MISGDYTEAYKATNEGRGEHDPPELSLLMRTDIMEITGAIAIEAQQLEPAILWKAVLTQPTIELAATSNFSMFSSIVIRVINRQNFGTCITTTHASSTVSGQSFLTEISVPNLHMGSLPRLTIDILEPVAVGTEQLKVLFRKTLLTKPQVKAMTITGNTTMLGTIVVNVVHRKESRMRFTANNANTSISGENLLTKMTPGLFCLTTAIVTRSITILSGTNQTISTYTSLSSPGRAITILFILTNTHFLLLFRRFSEESFTPSLAALLMILLMSEIVIMAAGFALAAKTIFRRALFIKKVYRKPLLAPEAIFFVRIILPTFATSITHATAIPNRYYHKSYIYDDILQRTFHAYKAYKSHASHLYRFYCDASIQQ